MKIQQYIKKYLEDRASEHRIEDIRIGLGYTAVMLENGSTGLAGTPLRHVRHGCTVFDRMLPLTGANASDLLSLTDSKDPLETAAGLATANALSNIFRPEMDTGDVLDSVNLDKTDHVGMVGNFAPLVGTIKNSGAELTIFEQIESPAGGMLPAGQIPEVLPECSVCMLTATSIINHTFDTIIEFAAHCRSVVLLGASVPLIPEIFSHTPVTCLSGVLVTKPREIMHIVSCGGGMRRFGGVVSKVNLAVQN